MGIPWMTTAELSQAIQPAYSEFLAKQYSASNASAPKVQQDPQ